jgi:hypothetical protein
MWSLVLVSVASLQHSEVPVEKTLMFKNEKDCYSVMIDEYYIDGTKYIIDQKCTLVHPKPKPEIPLDKQDKVVYK